jgi:hypothetical protein
VRSAREDFTSDGFTVGDYLLSRLAEIGIPHVFGVPDDYDLAFLGPWRVSRRARAAAELAENPPRLELRVRALARGAEFRVDAVGCFLRLRLVLPCTGPSPGAAVVALMGGRPETARCVRVL